MPIRMSATASNRPIDGIQFFMLLWQCISIQFDFWWFLHLSLVAFGSLFFCLPEWSGRWSENDGISNTLRPHEYYFCLSNFPKQFACDAVSVKIISLISFRWTDVAQSTATASPRGYMGIWQPCSNLLKIHDTKHHKSDVRRLCHTFFTRFEYNVNDDDEEENLINWRISIRANNSNENIFISYLHIFHAIKINHYNCPQTNRSFSLPWLQTCSAQKSTSQIVSMLWVCPLIELHKFSCNFPCIEMHKDVVVVRRRHRCCRHSTTMTTNFYFCVCVFFYYYYFIIIIV